MNQIVYDCPYCKSKNMTFDIIVDNYDREYQEAYAQEDNCSIIEPDPEALFYSMTVRYYALAQCRKNECREIIPFILERQANKTEVINILRPPMNSLYLCPKYTPKSVEIAFNEAAQCYAHHCFIASLTMFRTCLDLATKELLIEDIDKDKTLFRRIEILCEQGLIRPRLEKMASEIRIDGNIAAHDGYVNQESLKSIFHFTIFLLRELFTDPTEMETNEERRAQLKQGKVK